jgi:hypothetical protein
MVYALRHRDAFSDVGARRDQWKLSRTYRGSWRLFDLETDIGEKVDLSKQHPEVLAEMISKVQAWSKGHTAPRWFDNRNAAREWEQTGMPNYQNDLAPN